MRLLSAFVFPEAGGLFTSTGTTLASEAATNPQVDVALGVDQFFVGQIENLTSQECEIELRGARGIKQRFRLRGKESVRVQCFPLLQVGVFVNGTVVLRCIGEILQAENNDDVRACLLQMNIIERNATETGALTFPTYDHTDINTISTTTVATPATGFTIRVYKITISVQGANRVTVNWDAAGVNSIIGIINFTGEGSFVYDFGDEGLLSGSGIDGILEVTTTTTAITDIDVISEDVL